MTTAAIQKTALLFLRGGATDMVQITATPEETYLAAITVCCAAMFMATAYAFMND
ncbi:hypothetical protein Rhsp01_12640 [Rhizobium sp. NBRC 114257]|uniref:Uncharacterized protein n=1 Tax=Rhizobium dioscoreae TaxID=2653122 RepID=A0ABQ0YWZ8_9HYPH|nr:hypothetical protein RsS93_00610 [Rhizobium dioscoreae]GLU80088.1 hypothetical protein Rhsp01_12640 [Rhizobium sp. NBRC 114257]